MISIKSWNISNRIRRLNYNREGSDNRDVNWANKNTRYETTITHTVSCLITLLDFSWNLSEHEEMPISVQVPKYTDAS